MIMQNFLLQIVSIIIALLILTNSIVTLKFPIDILGALIGGIIGLILVLLWDKMSRPKVIFLDFSEKKVNFGILHKLRFKITGRQNPGVCQLMIKWNGKTINAKWDEAPNPIENDNIDKFRPELVPATFYQPLFLKQEYEIPIIHQCNNNRNQLSVFSGWWFGRDRYGPDFSVERNTEITLVMSGNNFQWSETFKISEIINEIKKS